MQFHGGNSLETGHAQVDGPYPLLQADMGSLHNCSGSDAEELPAPTTPEWHRLPGLHPVGVAVSATRAGPIFRPPGLFQPLGSSFLGGEHLG